MNTQTPSTIVIAGAGYAGLAAARSLSHSDRVRVILIDQHDYHLLQFQLHEAAVNKIETGLVGAALDESAPAQCRIDHGEDRSLRFRGTHRYTPIAVTCPTIA